MTSLGQLTRIPIHHVSNFYQYAFCGKDALQVHLSFFPNEDGISDKVFTYDTIVRFRI